MLREKWWNFRRAAAVLRLQKNQRPLSTGSASHWCVKCAFMRDCKSQIKSEACLLDLYLMWKVHLHKTCHRFYSFIHKNPEDTSEVPNGFLSDINPVSTPRTQPLLGLTDICGFITCFFLFPLEFPAYHHGCLSG